MASVVSSDDFTANALADNGITVSRTPVTKTVSSMGDETLTEGTPEDILAIFSAKIDQFTQEKYGLHKETDAYIMVGPSTTVNKDDKITQGGRDFRIVNVRARGPSGDIVFYKFVELHLITG